jgi:hypothetical protein
VPTNIGSPSEATHFSAVPRLSFVVLFRKIKWLLSASGEETVRRMLDMEKQKRLVHFHKAEPCRKYPLSVEQRKTPASAEFFAF